mgnify:CR=1 FL=1
MSFFSKLFSRGPEDYLAKGDGYFAAHSYYEARTVFEDGLQACRGEVGHADAATAVSRLRRAETVDHGDTVVPAERSQIRYRAGVAAGAFESGVVRESIKNNFFPFNLAKINFSFSSSPMNFEPM